MPAEPLPEALNLAAREIVDSAYRIHQTLGPGLLESVYEACLVHELGQRAITARRQVALPVTYEGMRIDAGFRLDLVVAEGVVVEVKSVEKIVPIHQAQLMTYLKLSGYRLGLLINFNVLLIKDGIKRIAL